jgi:tetratricopeptide (TPR) repeat protein
MVALDIALRKNPGLDLSPYDAAVRRQLSIEYSERARVAISGKQVDAAGKLADTAITLWDDNPDAYYIRAFTWKDGDTRESRDWIEAIRGYQLQMQGEQTKESKRRLAFALAVRAWERLEDIDVDKGTREEVLNDLQRAAEEARRSRALDESLPYGIVNEVKARSIRGNLYKKMGLEPDWRPVRQLADEAVRRFPDFSPAHDWRGMVLALSGDKEEAIREFTETLRLNPASRRALKNRAMLHADRKMCGEATSDLERFRSLGYEVDAVLAKVMGACGHTPGRNP